MVGEALLVVGKHGGQNVKNSLFVEVNLDCSLVNDADKDVEMGGGS